MNRNKLTPREIKKLNNVIYRFEIAREKCVSLGCMPKGEPDASED